MRWIVVLLLAARLTSQACGEPLKLVSADVVQDEYAPYIIALEKALANSGIQFHHQVFPDQRFNVLLVQEVFDIATLVSSIDILPALKDGDSYC